MIWFSSLAVVIFAVFLCFLPPAVYWLDAPEFTAAGWALGQPHPPGHPVFTLILKGFLLLPVGSIDFRANLLSAVFGAISSALTAAIASEVARATKCSQQRCVIAGVTAGIAFGLCRSTIIQSLSVEVYTFNTALMLGAIYLAMRRPDDVRAIGTIALLMGLGLANHHFLTVLAMPAVAIAFLRKGNWLRSLGLAAVIATFVTICSYGILMVRSLARAIPAWVDASTLDGVAWVASAKIFMGSLGGHGEGGLFKNATQALDLVMSVVSPPALVFALLGIFFLVKARAYHTVIAMSLLITGSLVSKVAMGILDPENPDDHGYFMSAMSGILALAASNTVSLMEISFRHGRVSKSLLFGLGVLGLLCIVSLPPIASYDVATKRMRFDDTVSFRRFLMDRMPRSAVAMVSHYAVFFLLQHDAIVEGTRPDVTVVQQGFCNKARGGKDYALTVMDADPDLKPLAQSFVDTGSLDWLELKKLARRRPVLIEASPDLRIPYDDLRFAGWMFELLGAKDTAVESFLENIRSVFRTPLELETRRVLLRNLVSSALWLAGRGMKDDAIAMLDEALRLNKNDRLIWRLREKITNLAAPLQGSYNLLDGSLY